MVRSISLKIKLCTEEDRLTFNRMALYVKKRLGTMDAAQDGKYVTITITDPGWTLSGLIDLVDIKHQEQEECSDEDFNKTE